MLCLRAASSQSLKFNENNTRNVQKQKEYLLQMCVKTLQIFHLQLLNIIRVIPSMRLHRHRFFRPRKAQFQLTCTIFSVTAMANVLKWCWWLSGAGINYWNLNIYDMGRGHMAVSSFVGCTYFTGLSQKTPAQGGNERWCLILQCTKTSDTCMNEWMNDAPVW